MRKNRVVVALPFWGFLWALALHAQSGLKIDLFLTPQQCIDQRALKSEFADGYKSFLLGQYREGLRFFQQKVSRHSEQAECLYGLALGLLYTRGPNVEVLRRLRTAASTARNWDRPARLLGLLKLEANEYDEARRYLKQAVQSGPATASLHFLFARSCVWPFDYIRPEFQDFPTAHQHLLEALILRPYFHDARFLDAFFFWQQGQVDSALHALEAIPDSASFVCYPSYKRWILRAWCEMQQGRSEQAWQDFHKAFAQMPQGERELYTDLGWVLPRSRTSRSLGPETTLFREFWESRDPEPLTALNERLLEHYRRVSFAREFFAFGKDPWDDRGKVYVRFGEPDVRFAIGSPYGRASTDIREGWRGNYDPYKLQRVEEYLDFLEHKLGRLFAASIWWFYLDLGPYSVIDFPFLPLSEKSQIFLLSDSLGKIRGLSTREREVLTTELPTLRYANLVNETPERGSYKYDAEPFDFPFVTAQFRSETGRTQLMAYFGISPQDLTDSKMPYVTLKKGLALWDASWRRTATVETERRLALGGKKFPESALILDCVGTEASPGSVHVALEVNIPEARRLAIYRFSELLEDFSSPELLMSSIVLAKVVEPAERGRFVRNGWNVIPNPLRRFYLNEPVWLYFEVYNLTRDAEGRTRSRIEIRIREEKSRGGVARRLFKIARSLVGAGAGRSITVEAAFEGQSDQEAVTHQLDVSRMKPGRYIIEVHWHDLVAGKHIRRAVPVELVRRVPR